LIVYIVFRYGIKSTRRDQNNDFDIGRQSFEHSIDNHRKELGMDDHYNRKGNELLLNKYNDIDEFGRAKMDSEMNNSIKTIKKPIEWPPFIEKHEYKYILDTRSGMFYDAESDFFYDPKSKLYYGNKKQSYYRYNPDNKKHFEKISSSSSNDVDMTTPAAPVPNNNDLAPDAIFLLTIIKRQNRQLLRIRMQ
jgi:hypothetical protein